MCRPQVKPVATQGNNQVAGYEKLHQTSRLPNDYARTNLWLLVRDPHWIFACWQLWREDLARAARETGIDLQNRTRVLRVYRLNGEPFDGHNYFAKFDIAVGDSADNWYIEVPAPDAPYCVELGVILPDGRFYALARSNTIKTPRDSISDLIDEQWATAEETFAQIFALSGGLRMRWGSLDFVGELRERLREAIASGFVSSWRDQENHPPQRAQ